MPSSQVMHKFKRGELHSGGPNGPVVTDPAQAKAILMSEHREEQAHDGRYPEREDAVDERREMVDGARRSAVRALHGRGGAKR